MRWLGDVDGARAYLAGEGTAADFRADKAKSPTRKVVYGMVADGLKVARLGNTGRRYMFAAEWTDEFLQQQAARPRQSNENRNQTAGAETRCARRLNVVTQRGAA